MGIWGIICVGNIGIRHPVGSVMRRRMACFTRSEASCAAAWPVLPGRKRRAPPRGPFYPVGSVARRRVARFTSILSSSCWMDSVMIKRKRPPSRDSASSLFVLVDNQRLKLTLSNNTFITIYSTFAQFLLDAEQLVIFCHPVGATQRTGLDLSAVGGDGDIGNGRVFRLA